MAIYTLIHLENKFHYTKVKTKTFHLHCKCHLFATTKFHILFHTTTNCDKRNFKSMLKLSSSSEDIIALLCAECTHDRGVDGERVGNVGRGDAAVVS